MSDMINAKCPFCNGPLLGCTCPPVTLSSDEDFEKEFEAFKGIEEVHAKYWAEVKAPKCHFTKMELETSDFDSSSWWECMHCGHTKGLK